MMGTPAEEVDTFKMGREILLPVCWKTRQPGRVIGKRGIGGGGDDDYHLHDTYTTLLCTVWITSTYICIHTVHRMYR